MKALIIFPWLCGLRGHSVRSIPWCVSLCSCSWRWHFWESSCGPGHPLSASVIPGCHSLLLGLLAASCHYTSILFSPVRRSPKLRAGLETHLDEQVMSAQHRREVQLAVLETLLSVHLEYSQPSSKNHCKWGSNITRDERRVMNNLLQVTCFKKTFNFYMVVQGNTWRVIAATLAVRSVISGLHYLLF